MHVVGGEGELTPASDEMDVDEDFVKDLVDVACLLADVAIVLNDAEGLDLAASYLHRAANMVAEEKLAAVVSMRSSHPSMYESDPA